jgi:hypothetical protein
MTHAGKALALHEYAFHLELTLGVAPAVAIAHPIAR